MICRVRFARWWTEVAPSGGFWRLAATVALFNAGVSVYLFLYTLFLLDLGLGEQRIGVLASAVALGSIASTIPMGLLARRTGLRRMLLWTLLALALILGVRAWVVWYPAQLMFAFLTGAALSGWVVCLSPAVAAVVEEKRRPVAFGIIYAISVATSAVGGVTGANLPGVWQRLALKYAAVIVSPVQGKRLTLLCACVVAALAAWPVLRLRCDDAAVLVRRMSFTLSPFLRRFLIASACWGGAISLFHPFTSIYFTRYLHVPLPRLGVFFAVAQMAQTVAVLCAPALLRRAGLVAGIVWVQISTALSLALLSQSHGAAAALVFYCGFMASSHMAEPGIQSLLMNRIPAEERSSATAMNYLATSLAQAAAASIAGAAFARFSYGVVLAGIAVAVAASGLVFQGMCGPSSGRASFAGREVAPVAVGEA